MSTAGFHRTSSVWCLRVLIVLAMASSPAYATRSKSDEIPEAYQAVAAEAGVPPGLLYAIAKAESNAQFSGMPWPWTLNVRGQSLYFRTRADAEACLTALLNAGIRSVDIGPMQVNWRWHADELISPKAALDPYFNLRVAARFLRQLYAACGNWILAAGRYHAPDDSEETRSYAAVVLTHWKRMGMQ